MYKSKVTCYQFRNLYNSDIFFRPIFEIKNAVIEIPPLTY